MTHPNQSPHFVIPSFSLFGEDGLFPDILHCERIMDRAAGHAWTIYPHRHAHLHQFFLVKTEGAVLHVDGQIQQMEPMAVVSIPRWTVHAFDFPVNTDGYVLSIPVTEFSEVFSDEKTMIPGMNQWASIPGDAQVAELFESLFEEFSRMTPQRQLMLRSIAGVIACHVSQRLQNQIENADPSRALKIISRFESLVRKSLGGRKKITFYSNELGISSTHLNRIMRRVTGYSTLTFIEVCTFNEACRQIAYTRKTIATIAFELGFQDPSYFSRAFKRVHGSSPNAYRKRTNGNER
ncbi:helix-turn-helix domain-containing protein [uncultured Sulfitobacter sp.]|uniref:helix-turn-helix domain-containing protein n=1 Tax=uncultured Sulfitobacter sp. TaxID=191468 RepID=UPI0030F53F24